MCGIVGYEFISTSDTEVLLNAYKGYGIDFLQKINGQFVFAIYDKVKDILLATFSQR